MRRVNLSILALSHDIIMAGLSILLTLYLRLGNDWFTDAQHYLALSAGLFTAICALVFSYMKLYRGMWHFASMEDLVAIFKAVTLAMLIFAFLMFTLSRLDGFPRSALLINWLLLMFMLGAPRFAYRLYKDRGFKFALKREDPSIPIILYGCGRNAELFVRDSLRNHESLYRVIAIIDHNPTRVDRTLHGIKIYDTSLPLVMRKLARQGLMPQRLVIADDITSELMQTLVVDADAHGLTLSRLPRIDRLEKQRRHTLPNQQQLKPIDIEDLLGRPQATRDKRLMQSYVGGKRVLVTGAGGSIGSELCRQLCELGPSELILLDHSEFALYTIHQQMHRDAPHIPIHAALIDVREAAALDACLAQHTPDIIFHAAAIKHVPLSEENPITAIHTNVIGTAQLLDAASAHHAGSVVLISTDKAVHPTNVMGASKRLAETIFLNHRSPANHIAVRFGNVLGSAGSVVPLFQQQVARGGPLTVTHPEMTRYFMTIREAVDLVIHAAALADDEGEARALYVLDMGEPVAITTLAKQIIRLSGLKPDEDISITYTGLRPGEKLYEELFYPQEAPAPTRIPTILQSSTLPTAPQEFAFQLAQLSNVCKEHQADAALLALKSLVTEYKAPSTKL